jgi:hypothetical protein
MTRKFFFFSEMGYNAYPLEALERYGYAALLFPNSIFDAEKARDLWLRNGFLSAKYLLLSAVEICRHDRVCMTRRRREMDSKFQFRCQISNALSRPR